MALVSRIELPLDNLQVRAHFACTFLWAPWQSAYPHVVCVALNVVQDGFPWKRFQVFNMSGTVSASSLDLSFKSGSLGISDIDSCLTLFSVWRYQASPC